MVNKSYLLIIILLFIFVFIFLVKEGLNGLFHGKIILLGEHYGRYRTTGLAAKLLGTMYLIIAFILLVIGLIIGFYFNK